MTTTLMTSTLWWLAENCLVVAAMVVVVSVACRFLRNRPAVQHALWLLVLVKFITPPIVTWPWSAGDVRDRVTQLMAPADREPELAPATMRGSTASDTIPHLTVPTVDNEPLTSAEPVDMAGFADWPDMIDTLPGEESYPLEVDTGREPPPSVAATAEPVQDSIPAAAEPTRKRSLSPVLTEARRLVPPVIFAVWLVGCVLAIAIQLRRIARHGRVVSRARPAPSSLVEEITGVARKLSMRPLPTVVAREIAAPFVWCLGWLRMIWPEALTGGEHLARSRGIIAHELAHVRRRDHWVAWLELAAGMIWWWNPLFWFVRRRLRESAEMACDAIALAAYDDRRAYAEMFLELSLQCKTGAPAPVLGVGSGTPSRFERRLSMILSDRVTGKASLGGLLLVAVLAALAIPGWSLAQLASDRQPGTEQPTTKSDEARNGETPLGVNLLAQNAAARAESGSFVQNSADGVELGNFVVVPAGGDDSVNYRIADLPSQIHQAQAVYQEDARKLAEIKRQVAERPDGIPEMIPLELQLKVLQDQIDVERLINHYYRLNMMRFQAQNRTRTSGSAHSKRPAEDRYRSMGIEDLDASNGGRTVPHSDKGEWDVEVFPGTSSDRFIRRLDDHSTAEATEPAAIALEAEPYVWQVFGFLGTAEQQVEPITKLRVWVAENQQATAREVAEKADALGMKRSAAFTWKTRDEMPLTLLEASADLLEGGISRAVRVDGGFFLVRWARRDTVQPRYGRGGSFARAASRLTPEERHRLGLPPIGFESTTDDQPAGGHQPDLAVAAREVQSKAEFDIQVRLLKLDVEAARTKLQAIDAKLQSLVEDERRRKENNDTSHNFSGLIRDQTLERDLAAIAVERAEVALELFLTRHPQFDGKSDPTPKEEPVRR